MRVGNFISTPAVFLLRKLMYPLLLLPLSSSSNGRSHGSHCRSFAPKGEKISANASSKFTPTRQLALPLALRRQKWQITPFREAVLFPPPSSESGLLSTFPPLPLSSQGIVSRAPTLIRRISWSTIAQPFPKTLSRWAELCGECSGQRPGKS